jgi:hypothetical protein
MVPAAVPQASREDIAARMATAGHALDRAKYPLHLVGIRGYYRDSMGAVGRNDIGIYDDALFVLSPNVFAAFNANTDPSYRRPKTATMKGMATLRPGLWMAHKIGTHKGYQALSQQMSKVTVDRDGDPIPDSGWHGITSTAAAIAPRRAKGARRSRRSSGTPSSAWS